MEAEKKGNSSQGHSLRFNTLEIGEVFEFWSVEEIHAIALKVSKRQAYLLKKRKFTDMHPLKKVKRPGTIGKGFFVAFRSGVPVLVKKLPKGDTKLDRYVVISFMVTNQDICFETELDLGERRGFSGLEQPEEMFLVYIILRELEETLRHASSAMDALKTMTGGRKVGIVRSLSAGD